MEYGRLNKISERFIKISILQSLYKVNKGTDPEVEAIELFSKIRLLWK